MSLLQRNISPWRYLPGASALFQLGDMSRKSHVHRIQFPLNYSPVMNQRIQKIQEGGRMRVQATPTRRIYVPVVIT